MTAIDASELRLGDVVRLRKPHACGCSEWSIIRFGTDIGLRCEQCSRRVRIERPLIERRVTALVRRGEGPTAAEILELLDR